MPSPEIHRYPRVPWEALKQRIIWRQGEHILVVGGTGSGKTTLSGEMLPRRTHVVICVSKGMDPIFEGPYFRGYERIKNWPPKSKQDRVLLWPENGKDLRDTREVKKAVFRKMFDAVLLHEGGWCIDIDETHYMSDTLRLEPEITDLQEQGRSAGISLWNNTQRPAGIPLACYANASHAFFFLTQEGYDVSRLGRIRNRHTNAPEMMANIEDLGKHEFVYIDRAGMIPPVRSRIERKRK